MNLIAVKHNTILKYVQVTVAAKRFKPEPFNPLWINDDLALKIVPFFVMGSFQIV